MDDLATQLFDACKGDNVDQVKRLLSEENVDPNVVSSKNVTPLFDAVDNGHLDAYDGWTALDHVCLDGHVKMAEILLETGINPNIRNEDGLTLLHHAINRDQTNIANLLLEASANVNLILN